MNNYFKFLTLLVITSTLITNASDALSPEQILSNKQLWQDIVQEKPIEAVPLQVFGIHESNIRTANLQPYLTHAQLLHEQSSNEKVTPEGRADYKRATTKQLKIALKAAVRQTEVNFELITKAIELLKEVNTPKSMFLAAHTSLLVLTAHDTPHICANSAMQLAFKAVKMAPDDAQESKLTKLRAYTQLEIMCDRLDQLAKEKREPLAVDIYWFTARCRQNGWGGEVDNRRACIEYATILNRLSNNNFRDSAAKQLTEMGKTVPLAQHTLQVNNFNPQEVIAALEALIALSKEQKSLIPIQVVRESKNNLMTLTIGRRKSETTQEERNKIIELLAQATLQYVQHSELEPQAIFDELMLVQSFVANALKETDTPELKLALGNIHLQRAKTHFKLRNDEDQAAELNKAHALKVPEISCEVARVLLYDFNMHTQNMFQVAVECLKFAAQAGYNPAKGLLASFMYAGKKIKFSGCSVKENPTLALQYAQEAYLEDDRAALTLAQMYFKGVGKELKPSFIESKKLALLVKARSTHPLTLDKCGTFFLETLNDRKNAFECFTKGGHPYSHGELVEFYGKGRVPESNFEDSKAHIDAEKCMNSLLCYVGSLDPISIATFKQLIAAKIGFVLQVLETQVAARKISPEQRDGRVATINTTLRTVGLDLKRI